MAKSSVKSKAKKSLPLLKKFGKKTYKKEACSKLKSGATKKAKSLRASGKKARVVKNPAGGYCVFAAGSASKKVAGTKRRTSPKRRTVKRRVKR